MMQSSIQSQGSNQPEVLHVPPLDQEHEIVNHILKITQSSGLLVDSRSMTNLYIGLKSNPLIIIAGPTHTGKIAAVQTLAKGLIGVDPLRCQMMVGHSWWVNEHTDAVLFVETQTRWNSNKIFDLIEEASLPENAQRMYIACLTRISPAELNEFFSEVAFQLRNNELIRISSMHITEPLHFPKNMFLIGTMDVRQFKWLDEDLASKASLIHWNPVENDNLDLSTGNEPLINSEKTFLSACLRNVQIAFQKLYLIPSYLTV